MSEKPFLSIAVGFSQRFRAQNTSRALAKKWSGNCLRLKPLGILWAKARPVYSPYGQLKLTAIYSPNDLAKLAGAQRL
jgi:hypothetical protein